MTIPSSIITDIASSTATIFRGSVPLIVILFGLGIAFYVVRQLIALLPKG